MNEELSEAELELLRKLCSICSSKRAPYIHVESLKGVPDYMQILRKLKSKGLVFFYKGEKLLDPRERAGKSVDTEDRSCKDGNKRSRALPLYIGNMTNSAILQLSCFSFRGTHGKRP
jgi:hypothetical protein